jgi:Family of unknown function (DUF6247)
LHQAGGHYLGDLLAMGQHKVPQRGVGIAGGRGLTGQGRVELDQRMIRMVGEQELGGAQQQTRRVLPGLGGSGDGQQVRIGACARGHLVGLEYGILVLICGVADVTAASQSHPIPAIPPLPEGSGPSAIRAALLVEEREEFDKGYRRALAEAAETLELACVLDTLEHWRRRAIMSADPQAYRRMLIRAARLLSGEDVSEDEPLNQLKERLARFGV